MKTKIFSLLALLSLFAVQIQSVFAAPLMEEGHVFTVYEINANIDNVNVSDDTVVCVPLEDGLICTISIVVSAPPDELARGSFQIIICDNADCSTVPMSDMYVYAQMTAIGDYGYNHPVISYFPAGTFSTGSSPATGLGYVEAETSGDKVRYVDIAVTAATLGGSASFVGLLYILPMPHDFCADEYLSLTPEVFEIDPIIETPLGPEGVPPDDQIYTTITGETYKIKTDGGPWNDGTDDRGDETAVSWDGETWTPFDELLPECESPDGSIYIEAESETFHIRVDDTDEDFADNTNNPDPVTYEIAQAYPLTDSCESQFSYDPESDLVASVVVPGNDDDVFAVGDLEVGEWYAITVTSGTWQDDGAPPDRTDMELKVNGDPAYNEDGAYHDLATGETGVQCQSTDETTWFVQAQNIDLYLRVNNESGDFSTNTGSLNVSIYHAAFERNLESCEFQFELDGVPFHDTVDATQEGGRTFAYSDGSGSSSPLGNSTAGIAGLEPLVPGAWYVLDTTDGPWTPFVGFLGAIARPASRYYEMAVHDGDTWQPLADWTYPACNVELDALGHRRIYFQMPPLSSTVFKLRVNDDETWSSNSGFMGWDLYRAINVEDLEGDQENPWESCLDDVPLWTINSGTWIPVKDDEGVYVRPVALGFSSGGPEEEAGTPELGYGSGGPSTILTVGDTYVIEITQGPWFDGEVTDNRFEAAITSDNGTTWYSLEDEAHTAVTCREVDQAHVYWRVMFTVQAEQRWKIRVNDTVTEFTDNEGNLAYKLYRRRVASDLGTANSGIAGEWTCGTPLLLPQFVAATDLPDTIDVAEWLEWIAGYFKYVGYILTEYFPAWLTYVWHSMQGYFAWCPQNAAAVYALIMQFTQKEPIATILEMDGVFASIYERVASYDWDEEIIDTSIFSASGRSEIDAMMRERFFPSDNQAIDPWEGGEIVDFSNPDGLPSYFYTCSTVFTDYLPSRLRDSVCFVNAYARETGLSFVMQMIFDIGGLMAVFAMFKRAAQEVIYMMTGVKPWTKSGAITVIQRVAESYAGGGGGNNGNPAILTEEDWAQAHAEKLYSDSLKGRRRLGRHED